jgi:hypothetical protein
MCDPYCNGCARVLPDEHKIVQAIDLIDFFPDHAEIRFESSRNLSILLIILASKLAKK